MDDVALVQRAAALDRDAFAGVYERYASRLYDYLWWVLRDQEEANDALYATFVEAGARLHELSDPTKLRPWLFAIASDEALHRRGHRSRQYIDHARFDEVIDGEADSTAPIAVTSAAEPPTRAEDRAWGELVTVVRSVADDLTPEERALLDLKYRQGLEAEELADAIGTRPEQATALVGQVSERVERLLGTTVVAFLAQEDCPELATLLGQWRRLDADQRQLVEEHAAGCPTCGERLRRQIPASALLGVSPAVAVPGDVGTRVLEDVDLATHTGRWWTRRRDGFPPPLIVERDRRRLAAAAGVVILLGLGAFLVNRGLNDTEQVASVGNTAVTSTTRPSSTTAPSPSSTVTTTSLPPTGSDPLTGGAGAGGAQQAAGATGGGGSTGGGGGGAGGGSGGGGGGGGSDAPATDPGTGMGTGTDQTPPPEPSTTVPDTSGPSLSGVSVSPAAVRAANGGCTNAEPTQATVSVAASDPSGISSVTASVAGPGGGSVAMTPTGLGTYSAVVGPFSTPLPAGFDFPAQVVVQATDGAGNTAATNTGLTIRCTG